MGLKLSKEDFDACLAQLSADYDIYAPVRMAGGNPFSDTDCIRYGKIESIEEVVFEEKSNYSYKEVLLPLSETLFYFTENQVKEADGKEKGGIIFLRSCDLHAVKRMDDIYLENGFEDYYYKRLREKVKFVLMGCKESFENCFCVSMNTNACSDYDLAVEPAEDGYLLDCKADAWQDIFAATGEQTAYEPSHVKENSVKVSIPDSLTAEVAKSEMWREYDGRCVSCGRCNFACPTCTCFTMQDIFYTDNGKAGERRRVQASCMVDGFTDVAGGGCYRSKNGDRMRFKVLHKVLDYKQRFGYHMCVGCGRCDDICPEYISFSGIVNKLAQAMTEVETDE